MGNFKLVKGMRDLLPDQTPYWLFLEDKIREVVGQYGYQHIRLPIIEQTELFKRSIGDVTDIVEKEMYTFTDRDDTQLSLRPEGTAGCVRACLDHSLSYGNTPRLWYMGPMFRRENPQKGRYRQFQQMGAEVFGISDPSIDAELILLTARLWQKLGISDQVSLHINSLGCADARQQHRKALVNYYNAHLDELDTDSQQRLERNPLRILDSKHPDMQTLNEYAPKLIDYLSAESKAHFDRVCDLLNQAGVKFELNHRLVRGLDYYNETVFEWVTESLGAQGAVCGGGRYDSLLELLGSREPVPATGFAIGLDRMVLLLEQTLKPEQLPNTVDAYLVLLGDKAQQQGLAIAEQIRTSIPDTKLLAHIGSGSVKAQFKKADKSGASVALVIGDDELDQQTVTIKYLREDKPQQTVAIKTLKESMCE